MKIIVCKQSYDDYIELNINKVDIYMKITCIDCGGNGIFEITKIDKQICNICKGSGFLYMNGY